MVLSGLKGSFFLIVVAATILTVFAFFTPGWRFYNHEDNEGLVINHYGALHSFEGWVVGFMILAFIFQVIILLLTTFSFIRKENRWFGMISVACSTIASLFLLAAIIFYSARFDEYYGRTFINANPVITRGYSFWFTVADLIFMLIGTIVGIIAFYAHEKMNA